VATLNSEVKQNQKTATDQQEQITKLQAKVDAGK
jgi:hypothetical protein